MRKINLVYVFAAITLAYFVVLFGLHRFLQSHGAGLGLDKNIGIYVDSMKLNSLGDFIAGIFSPLAFVWLIAAVLIQSKELKLQREANDENRTVMKQQAAAADEQAKFLGAQTAAMQDQTELLTKQMQIADQSAIRSHRLSLFDKRMEIYKEFIEFGSKHREVKYYEEEHYEEFCKISLRAPFVLDKETAEWIDEIGSELRAVIDYRSENPAEYTTNEIGILVVANTERHAEVEKEISNTNLWIWEQFSEYEIMTRFSKTLRLDD